MRETENFIKSIHALEPAMFNACCKDKEKIKVFRKMKHKVGSLTDQYWQQLHDRYDLLETLKWNQGHILWKLRNKLKNSASFNVSNNVIPDFESDDSKDNEAFHDSENLSLAYM